MAWLGAGAADQKPAYHPRGLHLGASADRVRARPLARGTVLLEVAIPDQFNQPLDLIDFLRPSSPRRSLHMVLGPNGRLWLASEQGQDIAMKSLDLSIWPKETLIRISYSWDIGEKTCWLSAEHIETGELTATSAPCTTPLHEGDLARVLFAVGGPSLSSEVISFAFADHIEPLGLTEGLAAGALVDTEYGPRAIETLETGTLIPTHAGGLSRLIGVVASRLPNVGHMRMLRLQRPMHNLTQTLQATPRLEIVSSGVETNYLFGTEHVTVQAGNLAELQCLPGAERPAYVRTAYNLVLSKSQAFSVSGVHVLPITRPNMSGITPENGPVSRIAVHDLPRVPERDTALFCLRRHEAIALLADRYH